MAIVSRSINSTCSRVFDFNEWRRAMSIFAESKSKGVDLPRMKEVDYTFQSAEFAYVNTNIS